jgi:hypothetical protein
MQTDAQIKDAIKQAEEACEDAENKGGCANAWDDVEELSAAASHKSQVRCRFVQLTALFIALWASSCAASVAGSLLQCSRFEVFVASRVHFVEHKLHDMQHCCEGRRLHFSARHVAIRTCTCPLHQWCRCSRSMQHHVW